MCLFASGKFQGSLKSVLGIQNGTGGGVLKICVTHSFLLTSASPTYQLHLKPLWRIKMCPWLRSCFLQIPERAADLHAQTHLSVSLIIPELSWQGWVLNFKRTFTSPFPKDRPLPLACSETSTKVILGAPIVIALGHTHLVTPSMDPSGPSSFLLAWHLT